MVLKFEHASGSPGGLVKKQIAGLHPQHFGFGRYGVRSENLNFNKCPGEADAAGPGARL